MSAIYICGKCSDEWRLWNEMAPPNRYTREEMVVSAVRVYDSYAEDGLCMKISFRVFGCNTSCVGEEKALKIQEVSEAEKYKILIL